MYGTPEYPLSEVPLQQIVELVESNALDAAPVRHFAFDEIQAVRQVLDAESAGGKRGVLVSRGKPEGPCHARERIGHNPAMLHSIIARAVGGAWLLLVTFAASAAPADAPAIQCTSAAVDILAGTAAPAGTRYSVATGMTVTVPASPVDWKIARCNANQIFLMHADPARKAAMTAMATSVGLAAWNGEAAFEAQVREIVDHSVAPGQHLKTESTQALTLDGRPCLDFVRSGTVDAVRAQDGSTVGPLRTRERLRACHLRDARGPEAAMVMVFKDIGPQDSAEFDDAARQFLAGLVLPPWMH